MASPNAPYYYGELKGGKKPPDTSAAAATSNASAMPVHGNQNGTLGRNGNGGLTNGVNNNPAGNSMAAFDQQQPHPNGRTSASKVHSLTDESPSSSSVSSSRPSSSRELQQPYGHYGSIAANSDSSPNGAGYPLAGGMQAVPPPAAFANPLLGIEPSGTESLPRSFHRQQKPTIAPKVAASNNKQGIYQRSLTLLANGVSPLLRKKHSVPAGPPPPTSNRPMPPPQQPSPSTNPAGSDALLDSSAASLARRRRKSEPIMFSLDSITNEINRLQQRQEQILENLNLEFDPMLMSDEDAYAPANNGKLSSASAPAQEKMMSSYGSAQQHQQNMMFGKEPLYMLYDNTYRSSRPEENIYEEVDLMTLTSLRAQYADTLSLQSWKKKGSRRGIASSSFTRWFSTRKKSPLVGTDLDENPYIVDVKLSKKQRPPIALPDIPPQGLTAEQLKRRYILSSIVESENSYISSLHRLINDYKKPLEESSPPILSQNKVNVIFHRLESVLQIHAIFGIALNQCVREWDEKERIGDVFIASFSKTMVLDIYSDFINNFTNAMETARKASKSKSAFAQFLHEKSLSSPDRLSFFGLMVSC